MEQYLEDIKAVIKQHEDGAITEYETVNKIFVYTNFAFDQDWYNESRKIFENREG